MFAHLTICTREVARTAEFYEQVLLWKRIIQPGNIEFEAAWLEMAPGQQLHIVYRGDFVPSSFDTEFGRHFAIFQDSTAYDGLMSRLRERDIEIVAPKRPTPFRRFFFHDPNGYAFEVIDRDRFVVES